MSGMCVADAVRREQRTHRSIASSWVMMAAPVLGNSTGADVERSSAHATRVGCQTKSTTFQGAQQQWSARPRSHAGRHRPRPKQTVQHRVRSSRSRRCCGHAIFLEDLVTAAEYHAYACSWRSRPIRGVSVGRGECCLGHYTSQRRGAAHTHRCMDTTQANWRGAGRGARWRPCTQGTTKHRNSQHHRNIMNTGGSTTRTSRASSLSGKTQRFHGQRWRYGSRATAARPPTQEPPPWALSGSSAPAEATSACVRRPRSTKMRHPSATN